MANHDQFERAKQAVSTRRLGAQAEKKGTRRGGGGP